MIEWIGFDADDTLWQNEELYREAHDRFRAILAGHELPPDLDDLVHTIEVGNLRYFGYGATSFVMSLIETAVRATDGRITGTEVGRLVDVAKWMIDAEVRVYDGVEETLAALAPAYPLALITKGDLQHQQAKVARSGLGRYFRSVDIVSDKTPEVYASVLARLGVRPESFVMVGNSLRSDILPVVELGGRAVFVPNPGTWAHEHVELDPGRDNGFITVASLADVPEAIASLTRPQAQR